MYPAAAVANAILAKARAESVPVSHMKLQKLVYIAHGWHLAVTGKPLVSDTVAAWPYGPVIPNLYQKLKQWGRDPIQGDITEWNPATGKFEPWLPEFPPETAAVVDRVWDAYKPFNALQLSAMTHAKGTPWYEVAGHLPPDQIKDIPIPDPVIHKHYVELGQRPKA